MKPRPQVPENALKLYFFITESSSIGKPIDFFNGRGTDIHEMNLPFARARIIYPPTGFMALTLSLKVVGDYSGIPATIKQN
jgi:hypothetical protein